MKKLIQWPMMIPTLEARPTLGALLTYDSGAELDEEGSAGQMRYIIGNAAGHQNGWCHIEHIFGRLTEIEP